MAAEVQPVQKRGAKGGESRLSRRSFTIKCAVVGSRQLFIVGVALQFLVTVGNLPFTLLVRCARVVSLADAAEGRTKGIADVVAAGAEVVNVFSVQLDGKGPFVERKTVKVVSDAPIGN